MSKIGNNYIYLATAPYRYHYLPHDEFIRFWEKFEGEVDQVQVFKEFLSTFGEYLENLEGLDEIIRTLYEEGKLRGNNMRDLLDACDENRNINLLGSSPSKIYHNLILYPENVEKYSRFIDWRTFTYQSPLTIELMESNEFIKRVDLEVFLNSRFTPAYFNVDYVEKLFEIRKSSEDRDTILKHSKFTEADIRYLVAKDSDIININIIKNLNVSPALLMEIYYPTLSYSEQEHFLKLFVESRMKSPKFTELWELSEGDLLVRVSEELLREVFKRIPKYLFEVRDSFDSTTSVAMYGVSYPKLKEIMEDYPGTEEDKNIILQTIFNPKTFLLTQEEFEKEYKREKTRSHGHPIPPSVLSKVPYISDLSKETYDTMKIIHEDLLQAPFTFKFTYFIENLIDNVNLTGESVMENIELYENHLDQVAIRFKDGYISECPSLALYLDESLSPSKREFVNNYNIIGVSINEIKTEESVEI